MRLKIIAGNLAVVLVLGLGAFLFVGDQLRTTLLGRLEGKLGSDRELFERSFRLSALEFVDLVTQRASERQMRDVFGGLDQDSRRTRAYEAAEGTAAWLADPARGERGGPDIVVVVDETGKALARNGARNVMFGQSLTPEIPRLAGLLADGRSIHDVWLEQQEKKVLQMAAAAIRGDSGAILGALVVGYDLSNGVAKRAGGMLGRDIAFLVDGKVYSSSLEGDAMRDLRGFLFGPHATETNGVLGGQASASQLWRATFNNQEYSGVTAHLPMTPAHPVAFAVLGNRSAQLEIASVVNVILVLTVLGAVLVILYGFVIGGTIMGPIEEIEEGVLAVINGKTDLRLEIESPELGGLAFRINQLLNVLTGTEEQSVDEEGRMSSLAPSAKNWGDAEFADAAPGAAKAAAAGNPDDPIDDPGLSSRLGTEDQAAYERRLYNEYAAAKQALGESVANIPQDRFHQRLAGRATALAQKHGCRIVRFQVETRAGQVVLRPVLIR
ncbi:MAG: MXAN_5187 C-terminal domain-containing protein [Polyangiales bacterium]